MWVGLRVNKNTEDTQDIRTTYGGYDGQNKTTNKTKTNNGTVHGKENATTKERMAARSAPVRLAPPSSRPCSKSATDPRPPISPTGSRYRGAARPATAGLSAAAAARGARAAAAGEQASSEDKGPRTDWAVGGRAASQHRRQGKQHCSIVASQQHRSLTAGRGGLTSICIGWIAHETGDSTSCANGAGYEWKLLRYSPPAHASTRGGSERGDGGPPMDMQSRLASW